MRTTAKQILFPMLGVACDLGHHDIYPRETRAYPSPFAANVRGRCAIERRLRGGSRPGMAVVELDGSSATGVWRWANGSPILWPDGREITYLAEQGVKAPDGSMVIDLHALPRIAASKGNAPSGVSVATLYRARVFAASGASWFCSRLGDEADWDYGAEMGDVARACSGNVSFAGRKGDDITAFMPVGDSYLYIATHRSLWCISGDPADGTMACVSPEIGVSGPSAWCWDGARVYFMNDKGLFVVTPGNAPIRLSSSFLDMRGTAATFMIHDPEENAVHAFGVSAMSNDGDESWFMELESEKPAFWPMSFLVGKEPVATRRLTVNGIDKAAFVCADGKCRVFSRAVPCEMPSCVAIGPFRVSDSDDTDGFLAELHVTSAAGSQPITATLFTGHSAEEAEHRAVDGTGGIAFDFTAGWNAVWRPRRRGAWAVVVLNCAEGAWAFEAMRAVLRHTGRLRP